MGMQPGLSVEGQGGLKPGFNGKSLLRHILTLWGWYREEGGAGLVPRSVESNGSRKGCFTIAVATRDVVRADVLHREHAATAPSLRRRAPASARFGFYTSNTCY